MKNKISVKMKTIVIFRSARASDSIVFEFAGPNPFPKLDESQGGNNTCFTIKCERGYAEKWLELMGYRAEQCELIEVKEHKEKFSKSYK